MQVKSTFAKQEGRKACKAKARVRTARIQPKELPLWLPEGRKASISNSIFVSKRFSKAYTSIHFLLTLLLRPTYVSKTKDAFILKAGKRQASFASFVRKARVKKYNN